MPIAFLPRDGKEGFSNIYLKDNVVGADKIILHFDAATIKKTDKGIVFYCLANAGSNIKIGSKDAGWKTVEECPNKYVSLSLDNGEKTEDCVKAAIIVICERMEEGKAYSGMLAVGQSASSSWILTGKTAGGADIPTPFLQEAKDEYLKVQDADPELLKGFPELKAPQGSGGKQYAPPKSSLELDFAYIVAAAKTRYPDVDFTDLANLNPGYLHADFEHEFNLWLGNVWEMVKILKGFKN
jgi:hypothetical protein